MFDAISYAMDNDVALEIIPESPCGMRVRIRDLHSAAQESLLITADEYRASTRPDILIEERCDRILAMIGKRKAAHKEHVDASAQMRAIEDFFRGR